MNKQSRLSYIQLGLLAAGSAIMFPYTFLPILRQPPANQDVWISMLFSLVYLVIMSLPALFLANRFRGLNINQINDVIVGKYFGKITAGILALFAMFCFYACLIHTVLYVNLYILSDTPGWAIILLMVVPITYASVKGAGTMGRLALIIVPYIIITIIVFMAMSYNIMDYRQLLPILADSSLKDVNAGAFYTAARYSEILIILVFAFYLKKSDSPNKAYALAVIVFALSFIMILMPVLLVLGPELAKISNNPYFAFTRQVETGTFMQRLQSINLLAWFMGTVIKLMSYNFIASYILKNMINKGKRTYYAIAISLLSLIIFTIPIMSKTSFIHLIASHHIFPWIVLTTILGVPSILCIIYFIRRKSIAPKIDQLIQCNEDREEQDDKSEEECIV